MMIQKWIGRRYDIGESKDVWYNTYRAYFLLFWPNILYFYGIILKIHALGYLANSRENNYNGGEKRCIIAVLMCG